MVVRFAFVLLWTMIAGLGCGRPSPTPVDTERLRAAIEAETGDPGTTLFVDHGRLEIRSGDQTFTLDPTETRERPQGLPEDIALPSDARIDLWTEGPRGNTLSLRTDLQPDLLSDFLRAEWQARGWSEEADVRTEALRCLTFRKADRQVAVTLAADPDKAWVTRALLFIETLPNE